MASANLPFALLLNATLLLCLVQLFDLVLRRRGVSWMVRASSGAGVVQGAVVGTVAILLITLSFKLVPGVVFDTRSVLLALSGLFLGPVPTLVAMAMSATFRAWLGGPAAPTGVSVIVASGLIGLAWRAASGPSLARIGRRSLYLLGLAVHAVMLGLMLLMPWELALGVLRRITLPIMIVHPLATLALGVLLAGSLRRQLEATDLVEREAHYRGLFDNHHAVMLVSDPHSGFIVDANPAAEGFYGWSREALGQMRLRDLEAPGVWPASKVRDHSGEVGGGAALRHRLADGSVREVEVMSGPVDLSGRVLRFSIVHDVTARVLADAERQELEQRFRRLIEFAPEALVLLDPESGKFTFANAAAERLFGLPVVELCRMGPVELSPPEQPGGRPSGEKAAELVAEALAGQVAVGEWTHRNAEGRDIPCEVRLLRLDFGGRPVVRGSVLDISERKAAEEKIRRFNRTYALLSEINQTIAREPDTAAVLAVASRVAVEVGGFPMAWIGLADDRGRMRVVAAAGADPATLAILRSTVEGDRPDCAFTIQALTSGKRALCLDIATDDRAVAWRGLALARGYRSLASLPIAIRDRVAGTFNLFAGETGLFDQEELRLLDELAVDLGFALELQERETRRQEAERALRASEERFRLLIENAPDMIHVIDNRGRLSFQSPSVEQILGYSAEEYLGRNVTDLVHPDDRPRVFAALTDAIRDPGRPIKVEYRARHHDGTWRWLETVGRSLPEQAEEGFLVLNSRDVTDSRHLAEQLRQAQKMEAIGQLAGGVAHDFNNLLTAMIMQADLAGADGRLPESAQHAFREIRATAERAAELTQGLLLFSRKQVMKTRQVDLNQIVGDLARIVQRIIGEDVALPLRLHPEPVRVVADASLLEQALLNLAINGRDAIPEGGCLTLETGIREFDEAAAAADADLAPGRYALLRVADTGCGIAPEHLPHIFEPFYTTKEPGKGTGLGLATVFGIVKQHGGAIRVDSRPGAGTTFEILLPALAASVSLEQGAETASATSPRGGVETILLVEDDASLRRLFKALLLRNGYTVVEAGNGPDAQKLFESRRERIDLLLTDLVMPGGMTGHQLAQKLRELRPSLKVVYVSGYSAETAGRELALRPGESFLSKPLTHDQLLDAIRLCLDT